jgi:Arc/MetJ-type ribon-helix-helix transcriptional regulator
MYYACDTVARMSVRVVRQQAKDGARAVMQEVAETGSLITYEELCERIGAYTPRSCGPLITEVALEDYRAGRGMLSAVVVRKDTRMPGDGFFEAAEAELAEGLPDRTAFWKDELARVYEAHRGPARAGVSERAISVRLGADAQVALDALVASGLTQSAAIRKALVETAARARRESLAEEARSLAQDDEDRTAVAEVAEFMDALSAEG